MYKDVCIGQLREPPMLTVGVGEVEDRLVVHQISLFFYKLIKFSFYQLAEILNI